MYVNDIRNFFNVDSVDWIWYGIALQMQSNKYQQQMQPKV